MKCVCQSLALCVQHAFEVIPSDVGYILSVISSSWFSNSDIRRTEYQSLFEAFEIDDYANEDSTLFGSVQVWLCLLSNFEKQGGWLEEGSLQ